MKQIILILLMAVPVAAVAHDAGHRHERLEAEKPSSESVYNLTTKWVTEEGKPFYLKQLRGKPAVVAMLYTSCQSACPLIVEDMKKIQRELQKKFQSSVSFLAVSLDPKRDSPVVLKEYKKAHVLNEQWTLVRGSASAVRSLAAVLGVKYKREIGGEFQHSYLISVLDKGGVIAFQRVGLGQDSKGAVSALESDIHQ